MKTSLIRCVSRLSAVVVLAAASLAAPAQTPPRPGGGPQRAQRPATVLLASVLHEIDFQDAPLEDALASLGKLLGTNIVVRWQELEAVGVERHRPVTLRVRDLRAAQVLWLLLEQAETDGARLASRIEDNLIVISTARDLDREMVTRVYDVSDLIATRLRYPTMAFARVHQVPLSVAPVVAEGAVGVQPVFGQITSGFYLRGEDSGGDEYEALFGGGAESDRVTPEEHLRQLVEVITSTIEPETWDVNGGTGAVRPYRGMLVVRNSPLVHQLLGGPLEE